jgi:hypothetical protein
LLPDMLLKRPRAASVPLSGGDAMVFAPAMGIACCKVLAAMCFFVSAISALAAAKLWWAPTDGSNPGQLLGMALVFGGAGLALLWFARLILRLARGE